MKKAIVLGLLLIISVVGTASAGGSSDKATGSGMWTNQSGVVQTVDFNAHEPKDNRPAKGDLYQAEVNGAFSFRVDVDYVEVYETFACFGGEVIEASGSFAQYLGQYRWTVVVDGGEGLGAEDYLRGLVVSTGTPPPPWWCTGGNTANNEAFSGGNVQIHFGGSYE